MGIEYSFRFAYPSEDAVVTALRRIEPVRELTSVPKSFELRVQSADTVPDASMQIEPYGLYFCDYGGKGREMMGLVLTRLVSEFGEVTIHELE